MHYEKQYCNGKYIYTKKDAQTALNSLKKGRNLKAQVTGQKQKIRQRPCRIYHCPDCNGWHLTGRENNQQHE